MINEGKGISDVIKNDTNKIWNLFINSSYSEHTYTFGDNRVGYKNILLKFNHLNNYYSNINVIQENGNKKIILNVGIPTNGKEKRVKEIIAHELTHLIEILGLGENDYPTYNNIKKSLLEFKPYPYNIIFDNY